MLRGKLPETDRAALVSSRVIAATIRSMDFQSLYEKYAPAVRRFALFLCGDRFRRIAASPNELSKHAAQDMLGVVGGNAGRHHLFKGRLHSETIARAEVKR